MGTSSRVKARSRCTSSARFTSRDRVAATAAEVRTRSTRSTNATVSAARYGRTMTDVYEQIFYEVTDPVATITLNRPDSLNAWTDHMAGEVFDALGRATDDKNVVGIVITGAGRGFCAGADLKVLQGISSGRAEASRPTELPGDPAWGTDFRGLYTSLLSVPKPIIAAINGPVAGMAFPFVLACDMRFVSTAAKFTMAFSQRGLIGEWGASWLLPRLVGPSRALDIMFSSRLVGAEEAGRIGLADRVVEPDELLPAARAYIADLAARCSPASMAVMKMQVYQQLHEGLGAAERDASRLMKESFTRPDFAEGVASFLERRPPQFARIGD
jgi:enoyl-CoA hydratase/carnithine racemase